MEGTGLTVDTMTRQIGGLFLIITILHVGTGHL